MLRRTTRQRTIILEELKRTRVHPSAEQLHARVKHMLPSISISTVYRNLDVLRREGLIVELSQGKCSSRYDADTSRHHHFICTHCRMIEDICGFDFGRLNEEVSRKTGFDIRTYSISFSGICDACKKNKQQCPMT
jgi:Fe2+ or Zn2+ uptake regulation protein